MASATPFLPRSPTPTAVDRALDEPLAPRPHAHYFEPLPQVDLKDVLLPVRGYLLSEPRMVDAAYCAARYADRLVITDDHRVLAYLDQAIAGAWTELPRGRKAELEGKLGAATETLGIVCQIRHDLSQLPLRIGPLCGQPRDPLARLRLSMLRDHVGLAEKPMCMRGSGLAAVFALCLLSVGAAAVGGVFAARDSRSEYAWLGVGLGIVGLFVGLMFAARHDRDIAIEQDGLIYDLAAAQDGLAPLMEFFDSVEERLLGKASACLQQIEQDPWGLSAAEHRQADAVRARQAELVTAWPSGVVNTEPG